MASTMNLSGFKELADALRKLGPRVAKNNLRRAVAAGAMEIRDDAKVRAPKDKGKLERAIAIKREKETRGEMHAKYSVYVRQARNGSVGQKNVKAYGKYDAYYWRFVEFGTSKMAAQPFMRPSYESKKDRAVAIIGEKLDEGIQKAARELAGTR